MPRRGENIYKRKDGRWEGRYIKQYDIKGKAQYGYVYGKTYSAVKKLLAEKQIKNTKPEKIRTGSVYKDILVSWLESQRLNKKESTYAHYYVCDEWYQEPVLKGEQYVSYCLDFCQQHGIDLFMPRREMVSISQYKDRFTAAGIRVMVDDYQYVSILNQKHRAYQFFMQHDVGAIPDFFIATNAEQFKEAYKKLSAKYKWVCFKFVHDEGGKSYRLIDNNRKGYAALFKKQTSRISFDAAVEVLSEKGVFSPIMIMPFLPDEEISVDCLKTSRGLIAIPRIKDSTRIERVCYDSEILKTCEAFYTQIPLECPCNIQFKYLDRIPYLLEVNTRMSGGIQMACAASNVNIPALAVGKLLGIDMPWTNTKEEKRVTHVEVPVVLDR